MQHSKYNVCIDEIASVLAVGPNEKVKVIGKVYGGTVSSTTEMVMGKPKNFNVFIPEKNPVTSQPEMFCDIHDDVMQYLETIKFQPDGKGNFSFEVDTTQYSAGIYYLLVFYIAGENPKDISKQARDFHVLGQKEVDELMKVLTSP